MSTEQLDRETPIPMYHQIRQILEGQMLEGDLPLGSQLPTEQELCDQLKVSRTTVRKTLDALRKSGIIDRTRGRGSFVRKLPEGQMKAGRASSATEVIVLTGVALEAIHSYEDEWSAQIIRGADSRLAAEGFHTSLLSFIPDQEGYEKVIKRLDDLGQRLAGAICFAPAEIRPFLKELDRREVPWVTVNLYSRDQTHNFVSGNNFMGGRRIAEEGMREGYDSVLFVSASIDVVSSADRFFGFQQAWLAAGRPLSSLGHLQTEHALRLNNDEQARLLQLLCLPDRPRLIFCSGDVLASIVLKACEQCGLSVPGDVAVVGGTGLMLAEHTSPTLTVLAQPMAEIGAAAEAMLVEMIRARQFRLPGRYIPNPLIQRDSCPIGDPA